MPNHLCASMANTMKTAAQSGKLTPKQGEYLVFARILFHIASAWAYDSFYDTQNVIERNSFIHTGRAIVAMHQEKHAVFADNAVQKILFLIAEQGNCTGCQVVFGGLPKQNAVEPVV